MSGGVLTSVAPDDIIKTEDEKRRMERVLTCNNIDLFAYSNRKIVSKPVLGVVVEVSGLGFADMYREETDKGIIYAGKGILYVRPYHNPWAWMNDGTVRFCDDVVDVLADELGIGEKVPFAYIGHSMGGQQALMYTIKSKRTPVCCAVDCAVCDLVYHFGERADLPRTLYSAYCGYDAPTIEDALMTGSPVHNADGFPAKTKYFIYHCVEDGAVNISAHSRKLVPLMKERGLDVYYEEIPGMGHCDLPDEVRNRAERQIIETITERK